MDVDPRMNCILLMSIVQNLYGGGGGGGGFNLNYKSRFVAKGLLRTIFCGSCFEAFSTPKWGIILLLF